MILGIPNQNEVVGSDQHIFRTKRQELSNIFRKKCKDINATLFEMSINANDIISAPTDRIVFFQYDSQYMLEEFEKFNELLAKHSKHLYIITEVFTEFSTKFTNITIKFYPEIISIYTWYTGTTKPKSNPSKLYNCFIQRVDSIRQSWFYFLYNNNLLDKGYVSYRLYQLDIWVAGNRKGKELFDFVHNHFELYNLPHFENAYQNLRDNVPYVNFEEVGDLIPLILDSKYSLVLDTYAVEDQNCYQWTPGEKPLRSMLTPCIPLLFQQKGMCSKLESLGFKIHGHEDIDNLSWIQRQRSLLDILVNDSIDLNENIIGDIVTHNRDIAKKLQDELEKNKHFDDFFDCI